MSATAFRLSAASERRSFHDLYFIGVLLAFAAYALIGKGFAYAGVPPLFPGELILALGLVTLIWPTVSLAFVWSVPHLLLLVMMAWTVYRTLPFVGAYKIDALRDSVIVMYGLYAFVIANLILEKSSRIDEGVVYAGRFFSVLGVVLLPLYLMQFTLSAVIPKWPGGIGLVSIRSGEVAVHLAGAAVFALLGLKRNSKLWIAMLLVSIACISAMSRGGMMSIAIPLALAILLSGRIKPFAMVGVAALPILVVLYIADVQIKLPSVERSLRVSQVIDNTISIFGTSSTQNLDDTKVWRLRWWDKIIDYTFHGDYFWTGKGFGVNLAAEDGFAGSGDGDGAPLRSPHSGHMTILARSGIPGLTLWIMINASWVLMMLRSVLRARLNGDHQWASLFIFVTCYMLAALVDASFDVALEGPMLGIVFWILFGAGTGLAMAYRSLCRSRPSASPLRPRRSDLVRV